MARVIAFFNQKGGTAKTTSTLNVAAALAERGRRVLAIDIDPQASLTMATGVDIASLDASVYDVLLDEALDLPSLAAPTSIPVSSSCHRILIWPPPSSSCSMSSNASASSSSDWSARSLRLGLCAHRLAAGAEILSINILVAADELVIPIEPHPLSLMVLRRLFETVSRVRRLNPELRVHGFLPTKVHHSSRLAADMLATLEEEFPHYAAARSSPLGARRRIGRRTHECSSLHAAIPDRRGVPRGRIVARGARSARGSDNGGGELHV